jgi:hypothetical protein
MVGTAHPTARWEACAEPVEVVDRCRVHNAKARLRQREAMHHWESRQLVPYFLACPLSIVSNAPLGKSATKNWDSRRLGAAERNPTAVSLVGFCYRATQPTNLGLTDH